VGSSGFADHADAEGDLIDSGHARTDADCVVSIDPYYSDEHCTIYHGDCLDVLADIGDGDISVTFTSPPYNKGDTGGNEWSRLDAVGYGAHDDRMAPADYEAWQHSVLKELWRVTAEDGAIWYQHKPRHSGPDVELPTRLNPGLPLRQIVIWDRGSGFQRDGVHLVGRHEWVMLFARPGFRVDRTTEDVWSVAPVADPAHPASFPVQLPTRALAAGMANGMVLDPFMGSGTTLRAAKDLGRKSIGIEIEERYCEIAVQRLAQEVLFS
jgi:site-specific DNA-methyltransferase (adenine-specific)